MMGTAMFFKIAGAAVGSSIAVVFKPGVDSALKLLQRFVIGTILGVIMSPPLLDVLALPHTPDYWIAGSAFCGLVAYIVLQLLFSDAAKDVIRSRMGSK